MTARISCIVPFCKRTCSADAGYSDYCCPKHWPAVSKHLRRRLSKFERIRRRRYGNNAFWTYKGGSPERIECLRLDKLCATAWERCKRQAIERAAGI